ncbi:MAG: hypothetical protein JWM10_1221 [Myxococcaceae bacterium]|nr:hypothetical protein [Myxococcaceae bacterium]
MRVLVYDRTCVTTGGGLSLPWAAGSHLYRGLRRIDASLGVATWDEALAWLASRPVPIDEIQYWGHGTWGNALVAREALDASSLSPGHRHHKHLSALREGLAPDALVWFRTCETVGARRGIDFAERLSDFLDARVAGHTHVIGFHQSGLHGLSPGKRADWSAEEGLAAGTADDPRRAKGSRPWATRTITCLDGAVPAEWFAR